MPLNGIQAAEVVSDTYCILFDRAGEIQHQHRVITLEGAETPSARDVELRTRELASEFGVSVEDLDVLHVEVAAVERGIRYAVDPRRRRLVEIASDH